MTSYKVLSFNLENKGFLKADTTLLSRVESAINTHALQGWVLEKFHPIAYQVCGIAQVVVVLKKD